ncbi:unnamed protein product [Rhizoctonia solani]|uniref:Uncharacterized protein n=1 Tax=Rhizoctonia solani TaxID=456999 RepID=A0A8H2Y446_9AGAM|nr:unnamed protein product [Rhizoctonia solani]
MLISIFTCEKITTDFEGRTFTHYVHFQPVLPALAAVVGDPELAPFMKYYPEERWVARPDTTDGAMRVWEELWHSLLWWKFQDHILAHQCILYLVVYIDETSVSTIGGVHVWPIYLWVGNLPASIRKQRKGKGGAVLIGYLPKAQKDKGVRDMAGLRCQVYHNAIAKVFESLKIPSRYGTPLRCGDGIIREFVPVLAAGSADYMEFIRMVCILGHRSDFPCPTCLVPRLQQSKLSEKWPVRTVLETEDILQCALNEPQPSVKKTILQEQSLRSVRNAFNDIIPPFHSIYEAFVADPLHQIEQGVWGAHLWPWIRDQLDSNKKDVLDERFKAIPIYPDLKHFPNGVTALKYLTGKEHGVILKFIVPLIQDMILDKYRKIVLGSFRTLAVIHMLSKFTTHTDLSLEELERQILKFDKLHEKLHKKFDISANYPKLHSLSHLVTIIREHSTTDNYHTGLGEALHPQSKKDYRRTNHQPDFENQMLRMHQEREAIIHIRVQIDSAGAVSEEIEPELSELWDGPNVQFGAPDRHGRQLAGSFTHACRQQDTCYQKMPLHLRTFLYQRVGGFGNKTHFRESDLPHLDGMVVSVFQCATIGYISQLDGHNGLDVVRVTDNWRNSGPRRDHVLVQTKDPKELFAARLLKIFNIQVRMHEKPHSIAYVQPFKILHRNKTTGFIELADTGLQNFIFVEDIVRSCIVLPSVMKQSEYILWDLESPDMYLRLNHLYE